jgi:hypothetical protein
MEQDPLLDLYIAVADSVISQSATKNPQRCSVMRRNLTTTFRHTPESNVFRHAPESDDGGR